MQILNAQNRIQFATDANNQPTHFYDRQVISGVWYQKTRVDVVGDDVDFYD